MAATVQKLLASCAVVTLFGTSVLAQQEETRWEMTSVNGKPVSDEAWIEFSAEGQFTGNTGCNGYQGAGRFEANGVFIDGPVVTTAMACPNTALTLQQDAVMRVMGGGFVATSFNPTSHTLFLTHNDDRLEFNRQDLTDVKSDPPDPLLGPTIFDVDYVNVFGLSGPLNIREAPNTDAQRVSRVLAGTLLRSSGCEQRTDRVWCAVEFIDASGTQGWAAGEYLQPAPAMLRASSEVFDDIGTLTCSKSDTSDTALCDFGVARDGMSSAVVVVYGADGTRVNIHFSGTDFLFMDDAQGTWTQNAIIGLQDDAVTVKTGETEYVLPNAILTGLDE